MVKSEILSRFDFYTSGTVSLQAEISSAVRQVTLETGSYFYHEGDYCPQVALIGSGNIRVFKANEKGRQITLYHLRDGETCLVNMLCALLHQVAPAAAQAESTVEALIVPAATFSEWIRTKDEIRNHVFQRMSSRILEVMMLVEEVAFRKMDQRIASYLLQRFLIEENLPVIVATHDEIASELGTAREVVSRVLKDFERLGAIVIARSRISILNSSILRAVGEHR